MINWFKNKKNAVEFKENKAHHKTVFKDNRAKHKEKPFAVTTHIEWINRQ